LLGGVLSGYLVYEGVFPMNYLFKIGLSAMVIGGIGVVITASTAHKMMKAKFDYLTYTQLDVYEPANIITSARFKINQGGDIALRERSEYAYEKFHVDKIIDKILLLVESLAKTH
jgi:hypothetical protein